MHNWPGQPLGSFAIRPGPFFAATDIFDVTVTGRGGHGAKPHETIDPTVISAQIVLALQSIASRNADPVSQIVVSVTSFVTSSQAYNVIPPRVQMRGTVRTLSPENQDLAEARINEICTGVAAAMGAQAEVSYTRNYPVMANHDEQTEFAAEVARAVAGDCAEAPLVMGGEDFAFMLEERPGAYILVGNGDTAMVHSADYDFNDAVIPSGCSWWGSCATGSRARTSDPSPPCAGSSRRRSPGSASRASSWSWWRGSPCTRSRSASCCRTPTTTC